MEKLLDTLKQKKSLNQNYWLKDFFVICRSDYFFLVSSFTINPLLVNSVLTAKIISSKASLILVGFKVEVVPDQSNLLDFTSYMLVST